MFGVNSDRIGGIYGKWRKEGFRNEGLSVAIHIQRKWWWCQIKGQEIESIASITIKKWRD